MRCSKPVSEQRLRSTMACRRLGQHRAAAATCFGGILREQVSKVYGGDRLAPPGTHGMLTTHERPTVCVWRLVLPWILRRIAREVGFSILSDSRVAL